MTVSELIEKLKEMPQDKNVCYKEPYDDSDCYYVDSVFIDEDGDVCITT